MLCSIWDLCPVSPYSVGINFFLYILSNSINEIPVQGGGLVKLLDLRAMYLAISVLAFCVLCLNSASIMRQNFDVTGKLRLVPTNVQFLVKILITHLLYWITLWTCSPAVVSGLLKHQNNTLNHKSFWTLLTVISLHCQMEKHWLKKPITCWSHQQWW